MLVLPALLLIPVDLAISQVLALVILAFGLHFLAKASLFVGAALVTLGIGVQLVLIGWLTTMELLALWPLSLIIYGLLIVVVDTVDHRYYRRDPPQSPLGY